MLTLNSDGQPFSQAFLDAVAGPSPEYTVKLFRGGSEVACDIMRLSLTLGDAGEGMGADTGFQIGAVSSARVTATLLGCSQALERSELEVRVGVEVGGSYEFATVALVTVTKARASGEKLAIEAAGRIAAVLGPEPLGLPDGMVQAPELASAIASACGVTVELGAFAQTAVPVRVESYYTCKDALEALAGALGGFAFESGAGVAVEPLAASATFTARDDLMTLHPQLAEEDFVIDGLVVAVPATVPLDDGTLPDDTLYTFGTGRILVTDMFATAETAAALWANVGGAAWRPGILTLAALDPRVTCADVASVALDGASVLVPCRGISATFDGGWFGTMSAPGQSAVEDVQAGPLEARVEETALAAARATANATRAFDQAQLAARSASEAKASATEAKTAANEAKGQAGEAKTAANEAKGQASAAQAAATSASAHANAALDQLGIVQDVVGVLDWASKHGTFDKTADTAIQDGKVYFTYDGTDYAPVVEPDASRLSTYYELSMSEAMNDFILAHLAVTSRGLWVLPSGKGSASDEQHAAGYKLLLSTDGTYIYDGSGVQVAKYGGTGVDYASGYDWHVGGENAYIFYDASEGTITIGGSAVVLGSGKPLSELATDADARGYASDAQAAATAAAAADATSKAGAAEAAAKGYADAQVDTRARTFATGWEYRTTADTAVVDGKTYYTRSGSDPDWEWTAVESPVDADIATYWELLPERPVPPYSPGDVWLQGDGGAILACTAAKASGESFSDDDWTLASGYTDDAAAAVLEGGIEALRQADTALSGRIDSAAEASRNAIAALDGRVAAAEGSISGVSGRLVSLEDYVRVVGGNHLELGKAGSSVTASLENDRLAFLLLGQDAPVAYIAADEDGTGKLFVTQAVVVSELQFGHGKWAWTERKNGNMALKWRGGEA